MSMAIIGGGIAAAGGIYGAISANQKSQDAKGLQGQAVTAANNQYNNLSPYRNASTAMLNSGGPGGPQYTPVSSPLLTQANAAEGNTLSSLTDSPDYLSQAKSALQDWETGQAPVLAADFRQVGQNASKLGRIGSGGVTTQLGTLQSDYERNKQLAANQLIQSALDQTQQNKYATLGAAQGVSNQAYGQGAAERANQQNTVQQGINNRNTQIGQGIQLGQLGNSYNPSGVLMQASGNDQTQANADANSVGSLFGTAGTLLGKRGNSAGIDWSQYPDAQ